MGWLVSKLQIRTMGVSQKEESKDRTAAWCHDNREAKALAWPCERTLARNQTCVRAGGVGGVVGGASISRSWSSALATVAHTTASGAQRPTRQDHNRDDADNRKRLRQTDLVAEAAECSFACADEVFWAVELSVRNAAC